MGHAPTNSPDPMFQATLGSRDPDAPLRWLLSTLSVGFGLPVLIATPIVLAMLPMLGRWNPPTDQAPWVGVAMESPESGEDLWLQLAASGIELEAPTPVAPTPVSAAPPAEEHTDKVDPDQLVEPAPPEVPDETAPEATQTPETAAEGSPESEASTEEGGEIQQGEEDGTGDDASDQRPALASGTTPELAPGEMATCLVQPIGKTWDVKGCAQGLHPDAIGLARRTSRRGQVMVTLRGA